MDHCLKYRLIQKTQRKMESPRPRGGSEGPEAHRFDQEQVDAEAGSVRSFE